MIGAFTILNIGFSVFSATILLFAYLFFLDDMRKSLVSKPACVVLLGGLIMLQLQHFQYLHSGTDVLNTRVYVLFLLLLLSAFYFFSRAVLLPEAKLQIWQVLHLLPLALGWIVPLAAVPPLAFLIGTGYTLWFARLIYGLKKQSTRFKFEMFFFGLFALFALAALLLGLSIPYIDNQVFYIVYANSIGIAIYLVVAALIIFPELLSDIADITEHAYANSKLTGIDVEALVARLDSLIRDEGVYQNENLNLAMLAEMLDLSSHQLSELINTRFGYGFPRYVREQRITAAKRFLSDEPAASILSISLMTGFKSQSSFYAAFREITGESPGNYRKNAGSA